MTKKLNEDDMTVISGGGENIHVVPKRGGTRVDIRSSLDRGTPGGPGPGPEAEGDNGDGADNLFQK